MWTEKGGVSTIDNSEDLNFLRKLQEEKKKEPTMKVKPHRISLPVKDRRRLRDIKKFLWILKQTA